MATRTLYAGQTVEIKTSDTTKYYLPVQSASCEVSRPVEFVTTFGHINNVAAAQNNFTTCKASIKTYMQVGTGLTAAMIAKLTGDAIAGNKTVVTVSPNGFTMSGVISSIGVGLDLGSFGMADLTFNGLGEPFFDTGSASSALPADQANMPTAITPVTSTNITGVSGCANSFKFTLDLPNEPLACLGDIITGGQTQIVNSVLVTKFPLKSSLTLEGYGVDISNQNEFAPSGAGINSQLSSAFVIGGLSIRLPNPKLTSKSVNQAVGNVGATYNFTAEDVNAIFA